MKHIFVAILILATFTSSDSNALSCNNPLEIVFRCKERMCSEGFLGFHTLSGHHCRNILNVNSNDKIYSLNDRNSLLKTDADGIYSATLHGSPLANSVEMLEYSRCAKIDEDGSLLISCKPREIRRLEYTNDTSLESVLQDYASSTKTQQIFSLMLTISFPLFFLLFVIVRATNFGEKHRGKFSTIIILCTIFGLLVFITMGNIYWGLVGPLGIIYFIASLILKIFKRIKQRRVS